MSDKLEQRRKGAEMIIERCRRLADELGVNLKAQKWKEDVAKDQDTYTLIIHVGPEPDQIQLADTELEAYASGATTKGTDAKLKSIIKKRY